MLDDRTQYVSIGQLLASLSDGRLPEVNLLNFWAVVLARFWDKFALFGSRYLAI